MRPRKSSKSAGKPVHPLDETMTRLAGAEHRARQTHEQISGQLEEMRDKGIRTARRLRRELTTEPSGPRREALRENYVAAVRTRALADVLSGVAGSVREGLGE